jgi:hypothetical protein
VEGPAVSPHPTHNSNLSHLSPLGIPTGAYPDSYLALLAATTCGALRRESRMEFITPRVSTGNPGERSGGICSFSPSHSQFPLESPLSPCHPDRSEAKWRDLQCALRLSPILPGKSPGATNPQSSYPQPDFAMPGRNTRLSNKINPTESTNQLTWTALIFRLPIQDGSNG